VFGMSRRVWKVAVGLALAVCALGALAPAGVEAKRSSRPPALLGGLNVPSMGFGSTAPEADNAIAQASALHAKVVRVEVPWSVFEPVDGGHIDAGAVAYADRLVGDAAAAGIRVIMTVDSTPCWASSAPSPLLASCNPVAESEATSWPPRNPADYAAFVAFLARRYGAHLAAIEVWNEPDQSNEAYFAGPNKARNYAAVLHAAYPAIKAANASVPVLAGSLVGSNGAFLRALYAAGIKGYYNGLAVHYYTLTLASVRSIHEVQRENHDRTPLWLDEFGWSSCWPQQIQEEQACVTPQIQASNITNTLRALARSSYVAAAVIFKLQDSSSEDFGLLNAGGARKPAFSAFVGALTSPLGSVSRVSLSLSRKGGRVVASGSGPVGDFIQLEVFKGRALRYRTLFTLDRFNRYSITLPSALGAKGLRVRVFQYWSGVGRATSKSL
jgi:Cellulase (glycosyl hydrolase family 5)